MAWSRPAVLGYLSLSIAGFPDKKLVLSRKNVRSGSDLNLWMIYETLQILKEQVENYFVEVGLGKILVLENIALWESGSDHANKKVR